MAVKEGIDTHSAAAGIVFGGGLGVLGGAGMACRVAAIVRAIPEKVHPSSLVYQADRPPAPPAPFQVTKVGDLPHPRKSSII